MLEHAFTLRQILTIGLPTAYGLLNLLVYAGVSRELLTSKIDDTADKFFISTIVILIGFPILVISAWEQYREQLAHRIVDRLVTGKAFETKHDQTDHDSSTGE